MNLLSHRRQPKSYLTLCWLFPLQGSSCGKWRSSENKRLNTNVSAMTWPPSCHAASLWSTPTPRTNPSLTKETGWSDLGKIEGGRKCGKGNRERTRSGAPIPKPLRSTARPPGPANSGEKQKHRWSPTIPLLSLFLYHQISISLWFYLQWGISTSSSSVSLVWSFNFFCTTNDLVSAGLDISSCLLLLFMKTTFLKNHLFLLLICKSMW